MNCRLNEWQVSEHLELLRPFYRFTKEISSVLCTLSLAILNICTIERFLYKTGSKGQGVQITNENLISSLKRFFF